MKHSTLSHITAAIAFDEHLPGVLETAVRLAVRSQSRLRLLHVCDPWTRSVLATSLQSGSYDLVQIVQDEIGKTAADRLQAIQASLGADLQISTAVVHDEIVPALCRDAEENATDLLIVGASLQTYSNPRGMTTAIATIVDATVPVLVVHEGSHPRLDRPTLRVAVADDLAENGSRCLAFARTLAPALGAIHVGHVHVQDGGGLREILQHASPDRTGVQDALAKWREELALTMMRRAEGLIAAVEELGGHYHTDIAIGHVAPEIERSANAQRADFIIFGKHRLFHKEQLTVGRVPFKTMLQQHRAIIVTP